MTDTTRQTFRHEKAFEASAYIAEKAAWGSFQRELADHRDVDMVVLDGGRTEDPVVARSAASDRVRQLPA